jgi:hypothetical protein
LWAAPFLIHSGEVAGLFGIYNIALATVQEGLPREGTPDDSMEHLKLERIDRQIEGILGLFFGKGLPKELSLRAVANSEDLSVRRGIVAGREYVIPTFENQNSYGPMVMGALAGGIFANNPIPDAVVQFRLKPGKSISFNSVKPYGFDNFQILSTSRNGTYALGPINESGNWTDRSGFAAKFDRYGQAAFVSDMESNSNIQWRLNIFRCRYSSILLPPQIQTEKFPDNDVKILSSVDAPFDRTKFFTETNDCTVSWYIDYRERITKIFGQDLIAGLNNGSSAISGKNFEKPTGVGFDIRNVSINENISSRSSSDIWQLNESRLKMLRQKGILDSSLEELHGRSEDLLLQADTTQSKIKHYSLTSSSAWASWPVYQKVCRMIDDVVVAVLILLVLTVPFAYSLERVLVGSVTIYGQILWYVGFFTGTFLILYFSHPAFAISSTPIIIFLGFAIVIMSTLVIVIIMGKFENELKTMQGMTTSMHTTGTSSLTTLIAAMHMGISTMHRRPLRTALTGITIILLTFTILCFSSFGTQSGILKLFISSNPSHTGVFIHNTNWYPLSRDTHDLICGRWGNNPAVCSREWISSVNTENMSILITDQKNRRGVCLRGLLGLEAVELNYREDLRNLLGGIDNTTIHITSSAARTLGVKLGDQVIVKGKHLKIGSILNTVLLTTVKDMDGSSILPVDFLEILLSQQGSGQPRRTQTAYQQAGVNLSADSIAIVSAETARALGANLHGLYIYTPTTTEAVDLSEDLARILPFPVSATRENGVYRHVLHTVLEASGARDLFFPIFLGGLVIFGTMLGSEIDRRKEIYAFSALGLAPKHVAMLFFAESMIYSIIGGMGGYLLAQSAQKILSILSEYTMVSVPEMNMFSTNTIVTILIVMTMVMLSAVYPAIKASKSANPGLMRLWRPPSPDGNTLDLVFPFTVSEYDITGVVSFLKEHFENHIDTGLGKFMTTNVSLTKNAKGFLGLNAELALAPFDLGVNQTFSLCSAPSEIQGIDQIRIILNRLSGQTKDWQRLYKVFLDDLRQQFLIWRSLPQTVMEHYREVTLTSFQTSETIRTRQK